MLCRGVAERLRYPPAPADPRCINPCSAGELQRGRHSPRRPAGAVPYQPVLCRGVAERSRYVSVPRGLLLRYQPVLCRGVAESVLRSYSKRSTDGVSTRALPGSCREANRQLHHFGPFIVSTRALPGSCREVLHQRFDKQVGMVSTRALPGSCRESQDGGAGAGALGLVSTRALPGSCREAGVWVRPPRYQPGINPCSAGELQRDVARNDHARGDGSQYQPVLCRGVAERRCWPKPAMIAASRINPCSAGELQRERWRCAIAPPAYRYQPVLCRGVAER